VATDTSGTSATATRSQVVAVLGAIASAIGVIGFVAVVGGMVYWLRFDHLHLPADTMVADIPQRALVATGLSTLLPFIAWGFVAVCLAYLFDVASLLPNLTPSTNGEPSGALTRPSAAGAENYVRQLDAIAQAAHNEGTAAKSDAAAGIPKVIDSYLERIGELERQLADYGWVDEMTEPPPEMAAVKASKGRSDRAVQSARTESETAKTDAQHRHGRTRASRVLCVGILVAVELTIVLATGGFGDLAVLQVVGVCAVGIALAVITLALGTRTNGFALFGAAIFVSVVLFGTVVTLWRTYHTPTVQPLAVVRSGANGSLTGYFLAETSDTLYLARIANTGQRSHFKPSLPRLVVVPRSEVVAIEVGPLEGPQTAYGAGYVLLQEICSEYRAVSQRNECEQTH
jgi:hypothetical protein